MTHYTASENPASTPIESIDDHEALRDDPDVPFHEERDVVEPAVIEQVASQPDLAGVGIENADGAVLFRRATESCSWKIPVAGVGPDEDYAVRIREHVRETIGFDIELTAITGVWDVRLRKADETRTASRAFVIFSGSAEREDLDAATPAGEPVAEADWFETLPADASAVPGTDLFLE